ncbi:hypothetical protein SAMN04487895_11850 [Paenibacillus sophorae]|uniref:Uncharacterized protein n=1 Tax=Paenibacillus sophorae TaxID=1333845 RepID=A0A1H8UMG1_9BACL|nr:hypothetical protein [Paenibacillus sophorae]QWU13306.1 hypothetical protein KP014_14950 [Paenibacillus sophorae]SEP04266.1 hypothetical protein SAMN04487895_11850 [Paenibacillus sophorae]
MKKIEWLIAVLLIGMGMMCMSVSALSFRSMPLMHLGVGMMRVFACFGTLAVLLLLFLGWAAFRKKR